MSIFAIYPFFDFAHVSHAVPDPWDYGCRLVRWMYGPQRPIHSDGTYGCISSFTSQIRFITQGSLYDLLREPSFTWDYRRCIHFAREIALGMLTLVFNRS